jgi:hypothetical protein
MSWDNFSCVDMARKIKDEISAKLNAMTPEERHLYFEHINHEAKQEFEVHKRKREKF